MTSGISARVQYNYMDINEQAGLKGLKLAAEKGLAVIVMEPLMGGKLAEVPAAVEKILADADAERTPVDWALQWVWDQEEVSVVLSGMSTMEQVEQKPGFSGKIWHRHDVGDRKNRHRQSP